MELSEVLRLHYVDFCEVVQPVSLASKLRSLTSYDRDTIQCSTNSGRVYGVQKLCDAIIGKVEWRELYTALGKENLKDLAKILKEEYYRQHPNAPPCPQDEPVKSGDSQFEEERTDSRTDGNLNNRANSSAPTNSNHTIVINIGNVNHLQCGSNNIMRTVSDLQNGGSEAYKKCEEIYEVDVECDNSERLEEKKNKEIMLNNNSPDTVMNSRVPNEPNMPQNVSPNEPNMPQNVSPTMPQTVGPNEPTMPQHVSPQLSSSGSDSQDGGSPKVCCHDETAKHTAEKLTYQERNSDEMGGSAPSDNISSHDNTNTISQSLGHVETGDMRCIEKLGISLRSENSRCKEGKEEEEEEETELKLLT